MQLSVKDAAGLLDVSEQTIYRWVKQERIPAYRLHDQIRFNRAELLEWAIARRLPISPAVFPDSGSGASALPTLREALQTGKIVRHVGGSDVPSVLRAVVDVLDLPDELDREFLYQVLLAREQLGSTGVGEGIAIPHVRNPVVLQGTRPSIALCFLDHPIDFHAIDGQPVGILFTLISPTVRVHLHLLSRLGFVLGDARFKEALRRRAPREELLEALARAEAAIPAARREP
jgi:PTS system nitrogen regulatory IIA component